MRVLLDVDGCLCEYNFPKLVKSFFGVDISKFSIYAYDLADVLGVSPAEINTMFQEQVYGKPHFTSGAMETLLEWAKLGYEIAIFSNRIKYMGERGLVEWLVKYGIPFSGIDVLGTGNYDYHIDDSPAKLMATNSKIKLLYDQPWNKGCLNITKSLVRVMNWAEVKGIVNGIQP